MARAKRYHLPGGFYHTMLRGNDGQDIYFSDVDRCNMCHLLQQGVEKYEHRIHAFCFMRNHVHLLIQVGKIPLSKIIQNLAFRYTQRINRRNERIGHLFQGRFKAILIEEDAYFKRVLRYIHLNPVRARIVSNPESYFWSSHNAYLGNNELTWLTTDYGLLKFGKSIEETRHLYSAYVMKEESTEELEELRSNFKDGQILGDDNFLNTLRTKENKIDMFLSLDVILKATSCVLDIEEEKILLPGKSQRASQARGIITFLALRMGDTSMQEIALRMNREGSTLSSLLSRFTDRYKNSLEIQNIVVEIEKKAIQIAELQA